MSLSKRSLDDELSRKDFELPLYGDTDESFREFEDVYGIGWPSIEELSTDFDEEC